MMAMAWRLSALVLFAALLTTMNVSAQTQGLDLSLDRDMVVLGDGDPFGQLTCQAHGNAVSLESVTIIWVDITGEATELLTVTQNSPANRVSHDGILGNGTLENNNGYIFLDQLGAAVCDSSYFLCEATFSKPSGERERAIATAWPRQPQSGHSGQGGASNDTHAMAALEKRLAHMSEAFQMFNKSYQDLLAAKQDDQIVQAKLLSRLSKLEGNASSPAQAQSLCNCGNVTATLDGMELRLRRLENQGQNTVKQPTVCERGMNESTSEPFLIMDNADIGTQIRCDSQTDGGGWIVIQRRATGDVDFYRNWDDYRGGFGDVNGDFWLGNKAISQLTGTFPMELRIDLKTDGVDQYVQYSRIRVLDKSYRLEVGKFSGSISESQGRGLSYHDQVSFSTYDRDNDQLPQANCAESLQGGWWYKDCAAVNINGMWGARNSSGMAWVNGPSTYFLSFTEMKIRRIVSS